MTLISKKEFELLTPFEQGFVIYMQAEHKGSELKDIKCPYPVSTPNYEEFVNGERMAVLQVQDMCE